MHDKNYIAILFLFFIFSSPVNAVEPAGSGSALVFSTEGEFEFVKLDLVNAIKSRGMVISYVSHASDMLSRTKEASGVGVTVYDDAEILLFCKSDLSHRLVAANPHNIVMCPYAISIYTLHGQEDRVYLSIRKPFVVDASYGPVHKLLLDIIHETLDF